MRKQANLTQAQLAAALNISEQSVSKWENEQSSPDIGMLAPLAAILKTSVDYLLTGKENVRYVELSPYDLCRTDKQVVRRQTAAGETGAEVCL